MLSCPTYHTCSRTLRASCSTCSCASRASCFTCLLPSALWALFPYVPCCLVSWVLYVLMLPLVFLSFHASRSYFSIHLLIVILFGKCSFPVILWSVDQYLSTVWHIWNQIRKHICMKLQAKVNLKLGIIIIKSYPHRIDEIAADISNSLGT